MENKITKKDVINAMLEDSAINGNSVYVDFLTHELELLSKKRSRKVDENKLAENEMIKNVVLEILTNYSGTVTEISKRDERLSDFSTQRIISAIKPILSDGSIVKTTEKGKSIYSLAQYNLTLN